MTEWWYRRAEFDEEQQVYVVLHEDGNRVTYSFTFLDNELPAQLALRKEWRDDDGTQFEVYPFLIPGQQEDRQAIVARIIDNGRETAREENVDEFLCIIDIAKRRAASADLDDEAIEEVEGLFLGGPADAYTRRPYSPQRLHHHVERPDDECWEIGVSRAVASGDPTRELGWVCYAMHYPELSSNAVEDEMESAAQARLLDLEHHIDEVAARVAALHLDKFMRQGARVQDPDFAYMNDTLVFECISVLSREENEHSPTWQVLADEGIAGFSGKPAAAARGVVST